MIGTKTFLILFLLFEIHYDFSGKVISIADGDTVTVFISAEEKIKVRLNGIDCPEKAQDFGQRAKEFTSLACFGKIVKVHSFGKDKYGRTLGEVILPDGKSLNKELLKAGLAWHYKKYSSDATLDSLEGVARRDKKGLWSRDDATPPWEFRKQVREKNGKN